MIRNRIVVLGGSFNPIHNGHIHLLRYFFKLLSPNECRIIPAGDPWQKNKLEATPQQRVEMIKHAFKAKKIPLIIDQQEIKRQGATHTKDTLCALRSEFGEEFSIIFLIGSDQFYQLNTWKEWRSLFTYAHLGVASRPGYDMNDISRIPTDIVEELSVRSATLDQLYHSAYGLVYLAKDIVMNVSSTEIRAIFQSEKRPRGLLPKSVLEYIKRHHLYRV